MIRLNNILSHPVTVCITYCLIIISGQSTGFFYLTLLMLGLSHAALHSILGIGGLILLALSAGKKQLGSTSIIGLSGALCMVVSMIRFFTQPGASYNYPTFRQFVPLLTLGVFSVSLLLFLIKQFRSTKFKKGQSVLTA